MLLNSLVTQSTYGVILCLPCATLKSFLRRGKTFAQRKLTSSWRSFLRQFTYVNQMMIPGFMRKECFHSYFAWDTLLFRDFLHIPNSPFPLLTTSLFLRITADRQNSVWLKNSLYRREVETNAANSENFKFLEFKTRTFSKFHRKVESAKLSRSKRNLVGEMSRKKVKS